MDKMNVGLVNLKDFEHFMRYIGDDKSGQIDKDALAVKDSFDKENQIIQTI